MARFKNQEEMNDFLVRALDEYERLRREDGSLLAGDEKKAAYADAGLAHLASRVLSVGSPVMFADDDIDLTTTIEFSGESTTLRDLLDIGGCVLEKAELYLVEDSQDDHIFKGSDGNFYEVTYGAEINRLDDVGACTKCGHFDHLRIEDCGLCGGALKGVEAHA